MVRRIWRRYRQTKDEPMQTSNTKPRTTSASIKGTTRFVILGKGNEGVHGNQRIKIKSSRVAKASGHTPDFEFGNDLGPCENIIVGAQEPKITRQGQDQSDSKPESCNNGERFEPLLLLSIFFSVTEIDKINVKSEQTQS